MGNIVNLVNGYLVYDGMLSSKEKASIDEILAALRVEIPTIENELAKEYGKSVLYKYYLGKCMADLLEKYEISYSDRKKFWDEIKDLASEDDRAERGDSTRRTFYEQCYVLSQINLDTVNKLNWRQWQSLLDRSTVHEDPRIYEWIGNLSKKINGDAWREFEKVLNLYLKGKDTTVFENDELFEIYDSLFLMGEMWLKQIKDYAKEHPKSIKVEGKGKTKWSKKYYSRCFELKREKKLRIVDEQLCKEVFEEIM